jgi:pimeloyl-ACP methyl ester carboxylesterase
MGGFVISAAAERFSERVRKLVYLSAILPRDGRSLADTEAAPAVMSIVEPAAEGSVLALRLDGVREAFYHDCSEEDVARARELLCPQPVAPTATAVSLTSTRFGCIARVYVECLQDRALDIAVQRRMVAESPCAAVYTLNASHSPFFSMPAEVAQVLDEAARA